MLAKVNGSWVETSPSVRTGGVWLPVKSGFVREAGVWREFYSAGVAVILTASTNVNIQDLFDPAVWADAGLSKKVINPLGVTIGSNDPAIAALRTGTGWGGELSIENFGNIDAAGGNLGHPDGGNAFEAEAAGVLLLNNGLVRSGGGLGGHGGAGGGGSYQSGVSEGPAGSYSTGGGGYDPYFTRFIWNGSTVYYTSGWHVSYRNINSVTVGIYTYTRSGSQVIRSYTATYYTSGGAQVPGGRGEGFDGARQFGSAGLPGGTNAGASGASGAGGLFGLDGANGNPGANGNESAGAPAGAKGLAGKSILNLANVALSGSGTFAGPGA